MSDNNHNNSNNNNKSKNFNNNATTYEKIVLTDDFLQKITDKFDNTCISIDKIQNISFENLVVISKKLFNNADNFNQKSDLVNYILLRLSISEYRICGYGVINIINNENYGFVRSRVNGYIASNDNVFISSKIVAQYKLRNGDEIRYTAHMQVPDKRVSVCTVTHIHGLTIEQCLSKTRRLFNEITSEYPNQRFCLSENSYKTKYANKNTLRMVDLFCPIGKGQRGLIVAPPKSGKTLVFHDIAEAISEGYPDTKIIVILVSERPEEITETERRLGLGKNTKIFYADFSKTPMQHIQVANLGINYAKRLLEIGHEVVIFLDSVTRLARSYNSTTTNSGRSLSGGVDASALYQTKANFFGIARNSIEDTNKLKGSITIIATCLVETGSKMDDIIHEELKGTGNMEIVLSRDTAEKGIFPAIDIAKSSTRRIDLLYPDHKVEAIYQLRELIKELMRKMKSNDRTLDKNNDRNDTMVKFILSKFSETKDNNELLSRISTSKNY